MVNSQDSKYYAQLGIGVKISLFYFLEKINVIH